MGTARIAKRARPGCLGRHPGEPRRRRQFRYNGLASMLGGRRCPRCNPRSCARSGSRPRRRSSGSGIINGSVAWLACDVARWGRRRAVERLGRCGTPCQRPVHRHWSDVGRLPDRSGVNRARAHRRCPSRRRQQEDAGGGSIDFRHVGIEPRDVAILALKSSVHFRADFQSMAHRVLVVASPGLVAARLQDLNYSRLRKCMRIAVATNPVTRNP